MKKIFTIMALCLCVMCANAQELKCFKITLEQDGCVNTGDVPTDANISIIHNSKSTVMSYLFAGENNVITIEGLPQNMEIQKIEAKVALDDLFTISEMTASIGENKIGELYFQGLWAGASDRYIFAQIEGTYEFALDENVSHLCTDKLVITQTCAAEYAGTYCYNIYYTLSDPTGISNVVDNNNESTNSSYYSLGGARVANPNKGIYIRNGKKVLVK